VLRLALRPVTLLTLQSSRLRGAFLLFLFRSTLRVLLDSSDDKVAAVSAHAFCGIDPKKQRATHVTDCLSSVPASTIPSPSLLSRQTQQTTMLIQVARNPHATHVQGTAAVDADGQSGHAGRPIRRCYLQATANAPWRAVRYGQQLASCDILIATHRPGAHRVQEGLCCSDPGGCAGSRHARVACFTSFFPSIVLQNDTRPSCMVWRMTRCPHPAKQSEEYVMLCMMHRRQPPTACADGDFA
jgi:hypothetical protein